MTCALCLKVLRLSLKVLRLNLKVLRLNLKVLRRNLKALAHLVVIKQVCQSFQVTTQHLQTC